MNTNMIIMVVVAVTVTIQIVKMVNVQIVIVKMVTAKIVMMKNTIMRAYTTPHSHGGQATTSTDASRGSR